MSFNTFSVTAFVSQTLGTFLENHSNFLMYAYDGIREMHAARDLHYAPGSTVNFKIPGYPTVQLGASVTAQAITDKVIPYTVTDNDWFNVPYQINVKNIGLEVVGGKLAFTKAPFDNPNKGKSINPQARTLIDNYSRPAALAIEAFVEKNYRH